MRGPPKKCGPNPKCFRFFGGAPLGPMGAFRPNLEIVPLPLKNPVCAPGPLVTCYALAAGQRNKNAPKSHRLACHMQNFT